MIDFKGKWEFVRIGDQKANWIGLYVICFDNFGVIVTLFMNKIRIHYLAIVFVVLTDYIYRLNITTKPTNQIVQLM